MTFFVRHLVAFSVALHAVLGCCAHHVHASQCEHEHSAQACDHEHEVVEEVVPKCASSCACEHGQEANASPSVGADSPAHDNKCEDGQCSISASTVKVRNSTTEPIPMDAGHLVSIPPRLAFASRDQKFNASKVASAGFAGLSLHLALQHLTL